MSYSSTPHASRELSPVPDSQLLPFLHTARVAVEKARSIDEAKLIRDQAQALTALARQRQLSLEMQNDIAEIKLRAERRLGEMLRDTARRQGQRDQTLHDATFAPPKLDELGIERTQSHRWQKVASLPEPEFENYIEETKASGEEITTAGALRAADNRLAVHFSSETPEWYTPKHIIEAVVKTFGTIDLDPCSNSKTDPNIPARFHLTQEDDGLSQPWFGRVYMNPPYGREIVGWIEKLSQEFADGHTTEAIALIPARTDTVWFRSLPDGLACFIAGRLAFSDSDMSAPFPSVAWYIGPNPSAFVRAFAGLGGIYQRIEVAA